MITVLAIRPDGAVELGGREFLEGGAPGVKYWIDIEGLNEDYRALVEAMGFHPLAIEDTFTLQHQPRCEEYEGHLFAIVRGIDFNRTSDRLETLKLATFLTSERLVTVHRAPMVSVGTVRDRLAAGGRAPRGGLVHVLYMLYDQLISLYAPLIEEIGEELELLEEEIFINPRQQQLERVLALKQRLATVRRVMMPHRQIFSHLATGSPEEISDQEALYFRDVYDQVIRIADSVDVLREQLSSVRDTYMSVIGQRTNDVMKVLTIISAVLLPISVIAGIYGMNFDHMPELHSPWAYPAALGAMATVASVMLLWFKRRGWL